MLINKKLRRQNIASNRQYSMIPANLLQSGLQHHREGRLKDALDVYQLILNIDPLHFDALQLTATVLNKFEMYDEALSLFDLAITVNSSSAALFNNRGNTLRGLGRPVDALASYDKALIIRPEYGDALKNRGITHKELGNLHEAFADFSEGLRFNPQIAELHYCKANVLYELNRFDEALLSYTEAININPNYPEALNNRGTH